MVFMPGPHARMGSDQARATPSSYSSWQPPGGMLLTPMVFADGGGKGREALNMPRGGREACRQASHEITPGVHSNASTRSHQAAAAASPAPQRSPQ